MKTLRYFFIAALAMVGMNSFAEELVDFTAQGYANAQEITSYTGTNVSITFASGGGTTTKYYNTGTSIRMYAKNIATFTSTKTVIAIKFELDGAGLINDNNEQFSVGSYSQTDTKWTGSATEIVLTNKATTGNQIRLQKLTFYFEGDQIPEDVHIANTPETAYSIADAFDIINAGQALSETVYVKGKICQIDSYSSTYKSITYWISDAGTTEEKMLECYSGKGLNGADFAAKEDIAVGAAVIVMGTLAKFTPAEGDPIYEFNSGNQLYSYDASGAGIEAVKAQNTKFEGKVYNIAGQQVTESYKGLVIMNGKKMILK